MLLQFILLPTALLTALISGFFYAYSCSVNPGLAQLKDAEYLRAMQSINRAVLNPVFFAGFFGALVLLPVSTWIWFRVEGFSSGFFLLLASSLIYLTGVFGVTAAGNVPLNESLDKFSIGTASPQEISDRRKTFERPWNRYHRIRTWANGFSLLLLLWTIITEVNI